MIHEYETPSQMHRFSMGFKANLCSVILRPPFGKIDLRISNRNGMTKPQNEPFVRHCVDCWQAGALFSSDALAR
jgi:hypothetical protein